MPRKVRELIAELENHGFVIRGGKGSHRNFTHPRVTRPVTISGYANDDAKKYQESRDNGGYEMKPSARYVKIVEWSEEDQCFIGSCPGLVYGGCHGDNELAVFEQLCTVVDEVIELYRQDGKPLPRQPADGTRQQDVGRAAGWRSRRRIRAELRCHHASRQRTFAQRSNNPAYRVGLGA